MVVLSLFDGISACRVALDRSCIDVNKYYSSEIDKYAIKIAQKNYPDTLQLGSIVEWKNWNIETPDLITGGFPCQSWSMAGKQLGDRDERGKLFWVMLDIIKHYKEKNPNLKFFMENVKMKKEFESYITQHTRQAFGEVNKILINSALVSAQNRQRYYWSNFKMTQPEDKGILLKDVVFKDALFEGCIVGRRVDENGVRKDYSTVLKKEGFSVCMHNLYGGFGEKNHRTFTDKSPTLRTSSGGGHIPSLLLSEKALAYMDREVNGGRTHWDFQHHSDVRNKKSATIVANFFKGVPYNVLKDWECIRSFDPVECERLQTFPDGYTEGVSKTQRFRQLGNSWTVDVISHLFVGLKND